MYNRKNVQYTFRQLGGKIWAFFADPSQGLCYSNLTRYNTWTHAVSLKKDISHSFHADMDSDDSFHIMFQDRQGNIFYSRMDESSINTQPILRSKSPTAYDKHLFLVPSSGTVHFFFVIQHGDSWMLSHQTLNRGKLSSPKVIDYVTGSDEPFFACQDRNGSIYVFYQASDGSHMQIGFKKYQPVQQFWSEFTQITKSDGDMEYPRVVTDSDNIMHLCCQKRTGRQYELIYQQKLADRNLWTPEEVIHTSSYPFNQASILISENRLIIYWVRDDIIYHSISSDLGKTWSNPARLNFSAGRQLLCMSYKSNHPGDRESFIGSSTPGSFLGGLRLAFYQPLPRNSTASDSEDLRKLLLDTLNLLQANVDDLKEAKNRHEQDLVRIQSSLDSNNREFSKLSIKMSMLDSELSKIKNTVDGHISLENARSGESDGEPPKSCLEELKEDIRSELPHMSAIKELQDRIGKLEKYLQSLELKIGEKEEQSASPPETAEK